MMDAVDDGWWFPQIFQLSNCSTSIFRPKSYHRCQVIFNPSIYPESSTFFAWFSWQCSSRNLLTWHRCLWRWHSSWWPRADFTSSPPEWIEVIELPGIEVVLRWRNFQRKQMKTGYHGVSCIWNLEYYMGVSINGDTPSTIIHLRLGFSSINHPAIGLPPFLETSVLSMIFICKNVKHKQVISDPLKVLMVGVSKTREISHDSGLLNTFNRIYDAKLIRVRMMKNAHRIIDKVLV